MEAKKKVALITGANKGIGFAATKRLAGLGYFVYLGCRNNANSANALTKLAEAGFQDVEVLETDVTKSSTIEEAASQIKNRFGYLDVLVNNAGILGEMPQQASTNTVENMKKVFETNYFGAVQTTQILLDLMKQSEAPRIVNVSSDLGSLTQSSNPDYPFYEVKLLGYNSSKTALNALTVTLAHELKDTPFKVNSVNPGYTATDLNGHTGTQTADEAAKIIVEYATVGADGPTGKFFSDYGETPW